MILFLIGLKMRNKVLLIGFSLSKDSFGGVDNYNKLLTNNFRSKKLELNYFSIGNSLNWSNSNIKNSKFKYILNHFTTALDLAKKVKSEKIDLVHINSTFSFFDLFRFSLFSFFAKLSGAKSLLFVRGWHETTYLRIESNFLLKNVFKYLMSLYSFFLVLSKEYKVKLGSIIKMDKIGLSSVMVDKNIFNNNTTLSSRINNLLFCGSLFKTKGVYEMLESFLISIKSNKKLKLIIMGDGPERRNMVDFCISNNINDKVLFLGHVQGEIKASFFSSCGILLLPSYREGFPNVVVEALSSGMVVISTKVGAVNDVIKQGKNGFLISSNPPEVGEISSIISEITNDKSRFSKICNANLLLSENFSVSKVCKEIEDYYEITITNK